MDNLIKKEKFDIDLVKKDLENLNISQNISEKKRNFYVKMVEDWMNTTQDAKYLGLAKNELGDIVAILYKYNTIYLMGEPYRTIMYAPKLLFHYMGKNHIHIDDILVKYNNIGNGSILVNALKKLAKQNNIYVITGNLSEIDDDHRDRQEHFYKKLDFKIYDKMIELLL